MIVVSGKACARSTRSGSCGWKCQESKVRPNLPSSAKPSRNFGSSRRCGGIGQEIEAAYRGVPEMMMRIDDRQLGLKGCFRRALRQPSLQIGIAAMDQSAIFTFVGH